MPEQFTGQTQEDMVDEYVEDGVQAEVGANDPKQLERMRQNVNNLIESGKIPPEQAEKLARLNITGTIEGIQERSVAIDEQLIKKNDGRVDFGEDEQGRQVIMEVFHPTKKEWQPKFYPTKNGKYFNIGFVANDGSEYIDPENSQATNDDDLDNPEVQTAVAIEKRKLEEFLEEEKQKRHLPPERRSEFKETESTVISMRKIAYLMNQQEKQGRGVLIVEGEAGTGKNWQIDHIAHLTERPVFRFTCDASKETPELKYFLEFITDEKGAHTQRINSTIIEALQTEGAILELDEINTLRPDVAKSLNSLFDADRAIYFGEDDLKVKAAKGVTIIGLMNPSSYAGVKPLAETIKSRARIITVDYPPFIGKDENDDPIFLSDEAEMVYQYFPALSGLNQSEFKILWHKIVNGKENPQADTLSNQKREQQVLQLKTLIKIANHIREAYRQYQEEGGGSEIDYNFTLRETADCANEIAQTEISQSSEIESKVKSIVNEIFTTKLDRPENRRMAEALISEV